MGSAVCITTLNSIPDLYLYPRFSFLMLLVFLGFKESPAADSPLPDRNRQNKLSWGAREIRVRITHARGTEARFVWFLRTKHKSNAADGKLTSLCRTRPAVFGTIWAISIYANKMPCILSKCELDPRPLIGAPFPPKGPGPLTQSGLSYPICAPGERGTVVIFPEMVAV